MTWDDGYGGLYEVSNRQIRKLDECQHAVERLRRAFRVVDVSDPYPDRPPSRLNRVYLEVRLP